MGSVSSLSPGITDLFQTLSNMSSSPLSSMVTTSMLKNASTTDIVQLSVAATQLEGMNELFGASNSSSSTPANSLNGFLENIQADLTAAASGAAQPATGASSASAASTAASSTSQLANDQTAVQGAMMDELLNAGSTSSLSGSSLDTTG
ncbi:MAG: hypothetical protein ACLQGV_07890 [Bryobacteraceae bacterium]